MSRDRPPASPPCLAHELGLGPDGAVAVDPDTARDVARWRKAERARLIAQRRALPATRRAEDAAIVSERLAALIPAGAVVALYWPIKAEMDLRPLMARLHRAGHAVALPVVVRTAAPLGFRQWTPGCAMTRGVWDIPVPADGAELTPDHVIAPLVGFDPQGYRLGYGGGFYDRTLAAATPRPTVIGVGLPEGAIPTIFPQWHDIAMDVIVTRDGEMARG